MWADTLKRQQKGDLIRVKIPHYIIVDIVQESFPYAVLFLKFVKKS